MENKYDWLNKRSIRSVDQLRLWSDNPRLNLDEKYLTISDFTEDLITDEADKKSFFELLKSIAIEFIPADPIIVWKDTKNSKFYVAEGNRRVLALKLLRDPDKAPKSIRAYVRALAKNVNQDSIEKILVNIAPTFEDAIWYINQRNSTSSLQRPWSRVQQQRWILDLYNKYSGNIDKICNLTKMTKSELESFIRILHLIDLVKSKEIKDKLTEQEFKEATSSKFPITILERFFSNKLVKEQWGIEFEGTDLKLKNRSSFFDAFSVLIKNIVSSDDSRIAIDTRTITSNLEEILKKLPKVDLEEQDECIITRDTQEQESTIKTKTSVQNTNKPIITNDPNRKQLIPPIYQLTSSDFRLNGLFDELKQLGPKYINVKAASLRIFLDLAVLNYIQSLGIEAKIKEMYKCNLRDVSLGRRLEYLKANNLTVNSKNIVAKLLDDSAKYTLSILNGYIHGKDTHYLDKQFLNGFWDFLFPLFCEILDIKESK